MNRQLAALSGVAMVLVVLHHAIDLQLSWLQQAGQELTGWQFGALVLLHRLGKFAVPTFLFVSGAFVAYAARGNPPHLSWHSVGMTLRRLLWPYLIWSVLFYAWIFWRRGDAYSALGYVKNLLVGYPYHFIPLLLFYYGVSPLIARAARRHGYLLLAAIGLYQLFLINLEFPGSLGFTFPVSGALGLLVPPILGETVALWGIYFPLGLVYSLKARELTPRVARLRAPLVAATVLFFLLDVLHTAGVIHAPLAVHLYPFTFLWLVPFIQRSAIPQVRQFEAVGKRSYGLYLTHLLVIDAAYFFVNHFAAGLFAHPLPLALLVFFLALAIPLLGMAGMTASPARRAYRFAFG